MALLRGWPGNPREVRIWVELHSGQGLTSVFQGSRHPGGGQRGYQIVAFGLNGQLTVDDDDDKIAMRTKNRATS